MQPYDDRNGGAPVERIIPASDAGQKMRLLHVTRRTMSYYAGELYNLTGSEWGVGKGDVPAKLFRLRGSVALPYLPGIRMGPSGGPW